MPATKRALAKIPTGKSKSSDITVVPRGGRRLRLPQVLQAKPKNPKPEPEQEKPEVKTPDGKNATPKTVKAKIPSGKEAGAEITTKDQKGRQAGVKWSPEAVTPTSGTWELALDALTGWNDASFAWITPGAPEVTAASPQTNVFWYRSDQIKLDGGAEEPVSGLPAGFTIVSATAYFGYWGDTSSTQTYSVHITWDIVGPAEVILNPAALYPADNSTAVDVTAPLANLLGAVFHIVHTAVGDGTVVRTKNPSDKVSMRLSGTYEIV